MGRIKPADKNKCAEQWETPLSFNYAYKTREGCLIFHEVQSQTSPLTSALHTFKGTTEVMGNERHPSSEGFVQGLQSGTGQSFISKCVKRKSSYKDFPKPENGSCTGCVWRDSTNLCMNPVFKNLHGHSD